jgi:hypothetical protein
LSSPRDLRTAGVALNFGFCSVHVRPKDRSCMNAVKIEQAVSDHAEAPLDAAEFPYRFPEAFGNRTTCRGVTNGVQYAFWL